MRPLPRPDAHDMAMSDNLAYQASTEIIYETLDDELLQATTTQDGANEEYEIMTCGEQQQYDVIVNEFCIAAHAVEYENTATPNNETYNIPRQT